MPKQGFSEHFYLLKHAFIERSCIYVDPGGPRVPTALDFAGPLEFVYRTPRPTYFGPSRQFDALACFMNPFQVYF